jgi:glycerol-3-phosphate dehydrogenase
MVVALAENAIENGGRVLLDTAALKFEVKDHRIISVKTNRGIIYPRVVINAAGVFADIIAGMAGDQFFSIHPRRGVEMILDKKAASKIG